MKIWKLSLAALLAAGVVYAYLHFPNPMEQQAEALAADKTRAADHDAAASAAPQESQ